MPNTDNERDLSLTQRIEETKDAQPIQMPKQFTLAEIQQHFTDSMNVIRGQFAIADLLLKDDRVDECKTVWRSQVVLSEGVLDFYLHEISKYCLFKMFLDEWDKTDKYNSFSVPMSLVEKAYSEETDDWFFSYLNDRFSRDVFLSYESMKDQLNLIGIEFTKAMHEAFHLENEGRSAEYGKEIVRDLFQRRNAIAHQNDRNHASAEQNDITKEFVEEYISKITKIVNAIQRIVSQKS